MRLPHIAITGSPARRSGWRSKLSSELVHAASMQFRSGGISWIRMARVRSGENWQPCNLSGQKPSEPGVINGWGSYVIRR